MTANMNTYNQLSALYAQRKEEYAKAQGAYEAYLLQKSKAEEEFKQSILNLQNVMATCPDDELSAQLQAITSKALSEELTPQYVSDLMQNLLAVISKLEVTIKECLQ